MTGATDQSSPSISLIRLSTQYTGDKLDKLKSNYKEWREDITISLSLNGLFEYISGDVPEPPSSEPRALSNWKANSRLAYAVIASGVAPPERSFLNSAKTTPENWIILRDRHQNEGPVRQVALLQQALSTQCTKEIPLPETAEKICTLIERAFAMGNITSDLLCCIALLNSLSSNFPHARSIISRDIATSTSSSPYTSTDIRLFLENEQSLQDTDTRNTHQPVALAASSKPHRSSGVPTCSNCKRSGHSNDYCISRGGGMEGKTIDESKAARRAAQDKKRSGTPLSPSTTKVPVTMQDTGGRVFTVMIDPTAFSTPNLPSTAFAGLASDPIPSSAIESVEYDGWLATEEETSTSIDWAINQTSPNDNALTVTPLNQTQRTRVNLDNHPFYVDTGATVHISPNRSDFLTLTSITQRSVKGIGGSSIAAVGVGDIILRIGHNASITLLNALYIPNAAVRLISVSALSHDSGVIAHFDNHSCWFTNKITGSRIAHGTLLPNKKLYSLTLQSATADHALAAHNAPNITTWHRRLGHANYNSLLDMARKGTIPGMPTQSSTKPPKCDSCILGKQTKTPIPKKRVEGNGHRATRRLEKVWVDLSGPHDVKSQSGNLYIMDIVDDYTSFPWSIPLKRKDDAFPELKNWELAREKETGTQIGTYTTDNGELKSDQMRIWLQSRGTNQRFTAPYTSAHIGRVERMHRTLMAKARTMRLYAKLPPYLWDEFYLTAAHLHAKTTTRSLDGTTPWEKWYNRKPDYSYMREIGCKAYVFIQNINNPKIYERSIECVLIGYDSKSKSYRCYNRATHKVHSSYHVKFVESHDIDTSTPLRTTSNIETTSEQTSSSHIQVIHQNDDEVPTPNLIYHPNTLPTADQPNSNHTLPRRSTRLPIPTLKHPNGGFTTTRTDKAVQESREAAERIKECRVNRKITLNNLCDAILPDAPPADHDRSTELQKLVDIPEADDQAHQLYTLLSEMMDFDPESLQFDDDPCTWEEAKESVDAKRWEEGYRDELKSLKDMDVYTLIPRNLVPPGHRIRKGRPVFHVKRDESGTSVRWKVRVVFKGFEQIYGKDYTKTTSPTARMESWRILLHIAASLGWDAQQIDVKTAFLYGLLPKNEVQFMEQPNGFEEIGKEDWVWKLKRGLYGMKQSGRIWNQTLNAQMISWRFTQLTCESCIYYQKTDTGTIIAAVHVDDYLSIASNKQENDFFKTQMRKVWTITDLGTARFVMGIAITWLPDQHTVAISQTALIDKIVSQFGQTHANPISAPMEPGQKLRRVDHTSLSVLQRSELTKLPYRSLVGCLLYLAISTRPDISYTVQQLSQFLDSYSLEHWHTAIRLVRYLKGTRDLKLHLGGNNPISLLAFTDSDWANCLDTRRSVGGYTCSLGSGAISWAARKQKTVAASSCEAEYIAAFEAAKECIWIRTLLIAIDRPPETPTTILCDNTASINLSEDPLLHSRVKHVDIKFHFLRERVQSQELKVSYINTKDNIADLFTKALAVQQFVRLRGFLGLH